jgi:predicted phosphodiesterase
MDIHDLVAEVKRLAIELGHTPTRREFEVAVKGGAYKLARIGGYTPLLQAAGLDTYDARRGGIGKEPITNAIFQKNIERHLEEYEPAPLTERVAYPKIAILGDLHEPFSHERTKAEFVAFCEKFKPDHVVQVGDSIDGYANAKFPKSLNVYTPKEEERIARKNLEEFWASVHNAAPQAKKTMLLGNHCLRGLKRVLESVPSLEHWAERYMQELLTFDNVDTRFDPREEFEIAGVVFTHGFRSGLGEHRDYFLKSVVCGHQHVGGVVFRQIHGRTLFELNAGLAADPQSKGLSYTPTKSVKWTLGWAAIDEWGPRFIPLR